MHDDAGPADHPQAGPRLAIAHINPGEQADQYTHDRKSDDPLKLWKHLAVILNSLAHLRWRGRRAFRTTPRPPAPRLPRPAAIRRVSPRFPQWRPDLRAAVP